MENTSTFNHKDHRKAVLILIMALAILLIILFWAAIQLFQLNGLPVYFIQLGLYIVLFLLAWWGLKKERITLPITARLIMEALAWTLIGWLFFLFLIQVLGIARLPEEIKAFNSIPAWKIRAQIFSTWFFVGMGEELLFRGYFLEAFKRHFTSGVDGRRTVAAILLVSGFFSLWHLPNRIIWLFSGEIDLVLFFVSLFVLFILGLGYAYLFIRSNNIILVGLVHGVSDFSIIGMNSQMTPIILLAAIGCIEISRLAAKRQGKVLPK